MQRYGHHRPQQEREMRGYQWLRVGILSISVANPVKVAITKQEYQALGSGTFSAGVQGPNVRFRVEENAITRQEMPRLGVGIGLQAGIQGPDVRSPVEDSLILGQEEPRKGRGTLDSGVWPKSVRPPITDSVIRGQEPSRVGYSVLQAGIQGPDVRPPTKDGFIIRQESGRAGYSTVWAGVQGPDVASGIGKIFTVQEQPRHPGPISWYFFVTPPGSMLLGQTGVSTTQLMPDLAKVVVQSGIQGPNVRPNITDSVFAKQQELPRSGVGTFSNSLQSTNIDYQRITWAFTTRQTYPEPGRTWLWNSIQSQTVGSFQGRVFVRQESPARTVSLVRSHFIPPAAVSVPASQTRVIIRPQDYPINSRRFKASPGVTGPDVVAPNRRVIQSTQEQVSQYVHPRPFVHWHVQYISITPTAAQGITTFVAQEYPRNHPRGFVKIVDRPNNTWPPFPTKFPPLQQNLTKDMLGKVHQTKFYADPGWDRQVITSINYPMVQLHVTGWTPIGGVRYPIGNMYNRDVVQSQRPVAKWFSQPDLVGGWITEHMNLTRDYVTLSNQSSFMVEPLELHVNDLLPQLYCVGLTPIGINTTRRGMLGVKPYA